MLDDVDDYVSGWHRGKDARTLHDFLGMTWDEYSLWINNPDVLPHIITAHMENRSLASVLDEFNRLPMAARSADPQQARQLTEWLKKQGKMR